MHPKTSCIRKLPAVLSILALLLLACVIGGSCFGQETTGRWDDIVGKTVLNRDGVTLGTVRDTVIDLENGRYLGVVVGMGGFLGVGGKTVFVPSTALSVSDAPRILYVNISLDKFRNAPSLPISDKLGPPSQAKIAEIYGYYGLKPICSPESGTTQAQIGFLKLGSRILLMPVDSLGGKPLGWVFGLRGLLLGNECFKGVVITPINALGTGDYKLVQPAALRYNENHTRLRLNDNDQVFHNSPDFAMTPTGHYREQPSQHPAAKSSPSPSPAPSSAAPIPAAAPSPAASSSAAPSPTATPSGTR